MSDTSSVREKSGFDYHKWLPWLIFAGVILGIVMGGTFPALGKEVSFIGDLFMRALLMLVVPLVMTSIIVGISQLGDVRQLGGLAKKSIFYFLGTTFLAAILGLLLVNIIQPGVIGTGPEKNAIESLEHDSDTMTIPASEMAKEKMMEYESTSNSATDSQRSIEGKTGQLEKSDKARSHFAGGDNSQSDQSDPSDQSDQSDQSATDAFVDKTPELGQVFKDIVVGLVPQNLFKAMVNTDLLPIIMFSLVFGAVVTTIGERGRVVIEFFQGANDAIMKIVDLLMMIAPLGICCLIAGRLGEAGGLLQFADELAKLGKYATTVIAGLLIHSIIILPLILIFLARQKNGVFGYFKNMWAAILTAFSTASSAAALPVTMESVIKSGVSRRNANFVLPLGTTLNMNGTALYEAVAAVFIAQLSGIHLSSVHMVIIAVTASLAAVGAASIPEAGLVTMLIVLKAAGLPTEHVSLILIIDWFLDRCRTAVNVWGDAVGAAVIDRFEPVVDFEPMEPGEPQSGEAAEPGNLNS